MKKPRIKWIPKMKFSRPVVIAGLLCVCLTGCGKEEIPLSYGSLETDENYTIGAGAESNQLELFASDYCATEVDITATSSIDASQIYAAGVYDLTQKSVLYSYEANTRVNPASLTKIMTALLTMEQGDLEQEVTIGNVTIYEDGIQLFGLKEGDVIKLKDLLYVALVYSGNDASLALAQYIGGNEETFIDMMNQRALSLGATNTNFTNPHGLSNENHYTTAYDLYLIFQEAMKYPLFEEIIAADQYTFTYRTAGGEVLTKTITSTNKYLIGDYSGPNNITVLGGKTGSTSAAGKCLILYTRDSAGHPYISIIMGAADEPALYQEMTRLCEEAIN